MLSNAAHQGMLLNKEPAMVCKVAFAVAWQPQLQIEVDLEGPLFMFTPVSCQPPVKECNRSAEGILAALLHLI
jgi:hypothetical protein